MYMPQLKLSELFAEISRIPTLGLGYSVYTQYIGVLEWMYCITIDGDNANLTGWKGEKLNNNRQVCHVGIFSREKKSVGILPCSIGSYGR